MTLVSRLLPETRVLVDLDVSSKKRLFEQVGLLFENGIGVAAAAVYDSLFARERLGSTGLGQGIALPHGRIRSLREAACAFVRLREPIAFESPDGNPVQLVFVLLVPEKATDVHLQILSEIAEMFSDRTLREAVEHAIDAAEVHRLITTWEPHAPAQRRTAV